ncbi:hypothetical protein L1887_31580 [Cichorium endivia]|nr:hypothetical protein L1887_31580 [Cichorium endivia]
MKLEKLRSLNIRPHMNLGIPIPLERTIRARELKTKTDNQKKLIEEFESDEVAVKRNILPVLPLLLLPSPFFASLLSDSKEDKLRG